MTARPVRRSNKILGALLATTAFHLYSHSRTSTSVAAQPPTTSTPSAPVPPPSSQPTSHEFKLPGTLVADQMVELQAKVSGYIGELKVDIGSRVHKGDLLVRIAVPELTDELR